MVVHPNDRAAHILLDEMNPDFQERQHSFHGPDVVHLPDASNPMPLPRIGRGRDDPEEYLITANDGSGQTKRGVDGTADRLNRPYAIASDSIVTLLGPGSPKRWHTFGFGGHLYATMHVPVYLTVTSIQNFYYFQVEREPFRSVTRIHLPEDQFKPPTLLTIPPSLYEEAQTLGTYAEWLESYKANKEAGVRVDEVAYHEITLNYYQRRFTQAQRRTAKLYERLLATDDGDTRTLKLLDRGLKIYTEDFESAWRGTLALRQTGRPPLQ